MLTLYPYVNLQARGRDAISGCRRKMTQRSLKKLLHISFVLRHK